jgi:2-phosphoglycerate kinase
VRAKVACLRLGEDPESAATARERLALAARHLAAGRVRVVLIGGPPATGKTTLAGALGRATGWPVLHSDEVRKELAGVAPACFVNEPAASGIYTASATDRTYDALLDRARRSRGGSSVILGVVELGSAPGRRWPWRTSP